MIIIDDCEICSTIKLYSATLLICLQIIQLTKRTITLCMLLLLLLFDTKVCVFTRRNLQSNICCFQEIVVNDGNMRWMMMMMYPAQDMCVFYSHIIINALSFYNFM
jgi:hypothetical protein